MATAYFLRHAGDGFLPIVNRGELAVLYCFLWLWIAARGARWNLSDDSNQSSSPSSGALPE